MKIDFIIGGILVYASWLLGFGMNSLWMMFAAFLPDLDIVWNEFWRIFIKKEKKFSLDTLLDEYSYTHRIWFHNPLIMCPLSFIVGYLYLGSVFGGLLFLTLLGHFIHDTFDQNFDGIRWLWPFSRNSIKWKHGEWFVLSPEKLKMIADGLTKQSRSTAQIFRDNK